MTPRPVRPVPLALALALVAAASAPAHAQLTPSRVRQAAAPRDPLPPASPCVVTSLPPAPSPCVACDRLFASDCSGGLWTIDPHAGTSALVGSTPAVMLDVAFTTDGRMFGVDASARLWQLDPCTGAGQQVGHLDGNALGGELVGDDLLAQGPPLTRTEPACHFTPTAVGGEVGSGVGQWCNVSSGDIAVNPVTGFTYSTIRSDPSPGAGTCNFCYPGDILLGLSRDTGNAIDSTCVVLVDGTPLDAVQGIAYEGSGQLWAVRAVPGAFIYALTGGSVSTAVPVSGGFDCGLGLASQPCP